MALNKKNIKSNKADELLKELSLDGAKVKPDTKTSVSHTIEDLNKSLNNKKTNPVIKQNTPDDSTLQSINELQKKSENSMLKNSKHTKKPIKKKSGRPSYAEKGINYRKRASITLDVEAAELFDSYIKKQNILSLSRFLEVAGIEYIKNHK